MPANPADLKAASEAVHFTIATFLHSDNALNPKWADAPIERVAALIAQERASRESVEKAFRTHITEAYEHNHTAANAIGALQIDLAAARLDNERLREALINARPQCSRCEGSGHLWFANSNVPCPNCEGSGRTFNLSALDAALAATKGEASDARG